MLLLIGGDSEIGVATVHELQALGRPVLATTRRTDNVSEQRPFLDLSQPLDQWEPPPGTQVACIFASVARMTACAADPAGSRFINVDQTLAAVDRLASRGIYVLVLSTNQVFNGGTPQVAADTDLDPISEYGRQKADMEKVLRQSMAKGAPIAILRLAKVVSPNIPLLQGWFSQLAAGKPVQAFSDMTLAPTPVGAVTRAIAALLADQIKGIFQLSGPRDVAYLDAGRWLAARIGVDVNLVQPVTTASAGLPGGINPRHTTLDSSLLRQRYGLMVPDAWEVMETVVHASPERVQPATTRAR
jgi:dTDP-4-dehydrorhamnose reductase